ncbi:unnamed protein product [Peniophora sp. CBMAI 1063]|nr:unnamed protein product [Peniophora sp. CBMAI 1063]
MTAGIPRERSWRLGGSGRQRRTAWPRRHGCLNTTINSRLSLLPSSPSPEYDHERPTLFHRQHAGLTGHDHRGRVPLHCGHEGLLAKGGSTGVRRIALEIRPPCCVFYPIIWIVLRHIMLRNANRGVKMGR